MDNYITTLEQRGFRITTFRKALAAVFTKHSHPLTVEEIQELLTVSVNKTTVYRELELLVEQELIKEVFLPDQLKRFERAAQKHHHHIVCVECNTVEDVAVNQGVCSQAKRIAKKSGFTNVDHSLEFFGVCPSCAK